MKTYKWLALRIYVSLKCVALKKAVDFPKRERASTSSWCISSQLWFLRSRHASRALLVTEDERKSALRETKWSFSCCDAPVLTLRQQFVRRYRSRTNSWCSSICSRYQHRDGPVSELCRCRYRRSAFWFFVSSSATWLPFSFRLFLLSLLDSFSPGSSSKDFSSGLPF